MSQRLIYILSTTIALCYALTERTNFVTTSEHAKKDLTEDKLLINIVRARNSSKIPYPKTNDSEEEDKSLDKQPRTAIHRLESDSRGSSCCGPRSGSNGSSRLEFYHSRVPGNGNRHSFQYGERLPADRYGWQAAQGQPPGSSGSGGRPSSGSQAAESLYEGSQAGDRFGSRPSYGSESTRRPSGYELGGYGYGNGGYGSSRPSGYWGSAPSGGYGISGTLPNGDEFGPMEPGYPEGSPPSHPNIQAQKAVALKALAGVALIGAAAALATNPVLLPIGIVAGRKKRSNLPDTVEDDRMNHILRALKNDFDKVYSNEKGNKISVSPMCIARLACEIQKNYRSELDKDFEFLKKRKEANRLTDLISSNVNAEVLDIRVKKLIKMATTFALHGGNCNLFTCTFIKTLETKKQQSVFKF
ncbi:uncharacterized protein LOC143183600 [Calliopsis andreniformis]|uniref:uncharacterized protein LOC143183600 n=1 Tax=Calliopsis andreniformis TaxID=337506 RepID=UPI003FCD90E7